MDILLKNMEMPTKVNHPLFIRISSDGHIAKGDFLKDGFIETEAKAVALPEHHGRLKDVDALIEKTKMWSLVRGDEYFELRVNNAIVKELLEAVPTIVEANNE